MNNTLFLIVKIICSAAMIWFCRMFFPYPVWIPVCAALAWVILFRVKLDAVDDDKIRAKDRRRAKSAEQESDDKPHWGKFK
ncbi:hypothetical protein [Desulfatibacillum aliphaticivorans]|uniref:hypothetical protein n=1 Tax=Desulfatibacillum aliphaticivorans TaxID=218208 RepID=UPI0003F5524D|nr:hypothetical protein [Desulfatibacillum aliphaticivorans]